MCEIKGDMGILLDCRRLYFGELKLAFSCELNLQVEQTALCIRTLRCKLINCLVDGLVFHMSPEQNCTVKIKRN